MEQYPRRVTDGGEMMARRAFIKAFAGVLATLGLASCDAKETPQDDTVAGESLYQVSYGYGGGMDGGSKSVELTRDAGGALLTWSNRASASDKEQAGKKKLDASAFDEFERMVIDYDLRAASECPDSEIQALDAATSTVTFSYVDEEGGMDVDSMFSVSDTQDLDDMQWDGFLKVCDALKALVG